jgi:hypothetical protein
VALRPPPRQLSKIKLPTVTVAAERLFRVSRHTSGEPYFGRGGVNRFDDRSKPITRRFGTCYFGLSLTVAIAETVLHDEMPNGNAEFEIAAEEFTDRFLVTFKGSQLLLAKLTGESLKSLAGDGSVSTVVPPDIPQLWAMAIERHQQRVDGILYMSRHINNQRAVVVFNRAARKLHSPKYTPLSKAAGASRAKRALGIKFAFS